MLPGSIGWIRKAKAQPELNLARDVKDKSSFYRYICQKRQTKEIVLPPINETGHLVITDMVKTEALNDLFASIFTGNSSSLISQVPEPQFRERRNKVPPIIKEDKV